jgi:hypothetical protein
VAYALDGVARPNPVFCWVPLGVPLYPGCWRPRANACAHQTARYRPWRRPPASAAFAAGSSAPEPNGVWLSAEQTATARTRMEGSPPVRRAPAAIAQDAGHHGKERPRGFGSHLDRERRGTAGVAHCAAVLPSPISGPLRPAWRTRSARRMRRSGPSPRSTRASRPADLSLNAASAMERPLHLAQPRGSDAEDRVHWVHRKRAGCRERVGSHGADRAR